jgi:hypothetical protein
MQQNHSEGKHITASINTLIAGPRLRGMATGIPMNRTYQIRGSASDEDLAKAGPDKEAVSRRHKSKGLRWTEVGVNATPEVGALQQGEG